MRYETLRYYRCPGCREGSDRPLNWRGVFCSPECQKDAAAVRALRKEMSSAIPVSPGLRLLTSMMQDMTLFGVDVARAIPTKSADIFERVFLPEPLFPADAENWGKTWKTWRDKKREVFDPVTLPVRIPE